MTTSEDMSVEMTMIAAREAGTEDTRDATSVEMMTTSLAAHRVVDMGLHQVEVTELRQVGVMEEVQEAETATDDMNAEMTINMEVLPVLEAMVALQVGMGGLPQVGMGVLLQVGVMEEVQEDMEPLPARHTPQEVHMAVATTIIVEQPRPQMNMLGVRETLAYLAVC